MIAISVSRADNITTINMELPSKSSQVSEAVLFEDRCEDQQLYRIDDTEK